MKLGLDYHDTMDTNPKFFSELTKLLKDNGHEVHILTGSKETKEIHDELKNLGIYYTHFFSISDYNQKIGTKMWYSENGDPWMDEEVWNSSKADYCRKNNIDLHMDNEIRYADHFTTPFARYFSKKTPRKIRETDI